MKTIVVATDFSASAEHATLYAVELAKRIGAGVLLLHVYQMPVTMSDFPVLIVSAEELKNNADMGLQKVKHTVQKNAGGILFETESRLGDVVEEIEDCCSKRDVLAVVLGTKEMSGFERFLLGNTAVSIINNASYPVITVPGSAAIAIPQRIALAVDSSGNFPIEKISMFIQLFGAELHVVHIATDDEKDEILLPEAFKAAKFHSWKDDDVTDGIQHFVEQNNIDMVLVLPHKHSLYERIFFKGHTKELVSEMPVPVLCVK